MHKVSICGHFGFGETLLNGQTVKTKIITDELEIQLGPKAVRKIDTHGGVLQIVKSVVLAVMAMFTSHNLIILPAHNGIRIFGPVLASLKKISRCRLHYVVIGGWLPQMLLNKASLAKALKVFDVIYVETTTMRKAMEDQGFCNVVVMPNCKKLSILPKTELVYHRAAPYPLCTFSRVMEEKGIEDAVYAVKDVNDREGRILYTLDIYGQVDPGYQERFSQLQSVWPDYISYRGAVPFDESVQVLKEYAALLFPTRFYTEGVPGTIIDAYAAGIPVISSRWESFADVVDEGITGIGYPFGEQTELVNILKRIDGDPQILAGLKINCLEKAAAFSMKVVDNELICRL